ncbi:origin recognition complex subunit 4 C-terminus-domain-containing protein [Amylocystis lapponica]|nr:origin recognition complex subunit 4 C-terminus-domain-containing protein [Amylocystis lapponica]
MNGVSHIPHVSSIVPPSTPTRTRPRPASPRNAMLLDSPNRTPRLFSQPTQPVAGPSSRPSSPVKTPTAAAYATRLPVPQTSPARLPRKHALLLALQHMPTVEDGGQGDSTSTNVTMSEQLSNLLEGTVLRGEGNSCLVIGSRGSGKTRLVEQAIAKLPDKPIVIRLSGYAQSNDRLAIREIAYQLAQQTGSSFLPSNPDTDVAEGFTDPENPFVDPVETADPAITLPPPAHLLALISVIPTLPRPTIVIIDAFDLFATHARQSLLYCLLDTVQSCRIGVANKGLAVIGVTTRVDTINLLEKRVKSRFSGRMLRAACPSRVGDWIHLARVVLNAPIANASDEWLGLWASTVEAFLQDGVVTEILEESFALTRDVHMLCRMLTSAVLDLTPSSPNLSAAKLAAAAAIQRCPPRFPFLSTLPYPAICLLIARTHVQTSGHDTFTFEMLHESFRDQVRTSQSAPVQVEGSGIGMAFERLVAMHVFAAIAPPTTTTAREFVLHRCAVDRADIKRAVEASGQTSLKKWFSKAQ